MMKATRRLLVTMLLLSAGAGGAAVAEDAAKPAPAAGPGSAAKPEMAKIDWAAMKKGERKQYMRKQVLPAAKKLFGAFDAKKYKNVTCQTCHGAKGVDSGSYKMPNPEIAKLPTTPDAFKELKAKKPEMVKFMAEEVKPHMAALLGMPEWTPQTPNGYGCYGCHQKL